MRSVGIAPWILDGGVGLADRTLASGQSGGRDPLDTALELGLPVEQLSCPCILLMARHKKQFAAQDQWTPPLFYDSG